MLIEKGRAIRFKLSSGGALIQLMRSSMLHDPEGHDWPKCSLLIGRFERTCKPATDDEFKGAPEYYFGKKYLPCVGSIELPPKNLDEWKFIGNVKRVDYVRPGTKAPGGYNHTFNKPRSWVHLLFAIKGKGYAELSKYGSFYRVDMPDGCVLDGRGIVYP